MEEESKKPRPGKGKNKAGETEAAAPVELDQHQVELQRCQDGSLLSGAPGVGDIVGSQFPVAT